MIKINKTNITTLLVVFSFFAFGLVQPVNAKSILERFGFKEKTEERREVNIEKREEKRENRQISATPIQERKEERIQNQANKDKKSNLKGTILSLSASVPSDMVITTQDGKTITLKLTSQTEFIRKYGGTSALSEFRVGHTVKAIGIWTDDTRLIQETKVLRNESIQKRFGTFWGKILSLDQAGKTFIIRTGERGELTVLASSAKLFSVNEKPISFSELKVNDRVRVSGLWDNQAQTLDADKIKDWSIRPVRPTGGVSVTPTLVLTLTPTPTPTVTPTLTPTPTP